MSEPLTAKQLSILRHSIGLDDAGHGREYRNHFCTGKESTDFPDCRALVRAGLMVDYGPQQNMGGMHQFQVTKNGRGDARKGVVYKRLTAAQQRYQDFLNEDSGMRFGEWLKCRHA